MSELQQIAIDRDLMVLDDLADDTTLPERDWNAIIEVYNQTNKPFPIKPTICAKIISDIKKGRIPKTVFTQYNISYSNFKNRFNKTKTILEELMCKSEIADTDWKIIQTLRREPSFILGQDIERARAYHFNQSTDKLKELSEFKSETWLSYMKEIHKDEFEDKQDQKGIEVIIQLGQGLLESV